MRSRLLIAAALLLVGWSLMVVVLRWVQVRSTHSADQGDLIRLRITSFAGSTDVPQPSDEWPSARAAWEVYQAFRRQNPHIALDESQALKLSGAASESAMLMSMAGRTAGEIIAVNYRVLENWVNQDFLFPLDDYVLSAAKENLRNPSFIASLPEEARPAPSQDVERLTLDALRPEWVAVSPAVWETIYRADRTGAKHVWAWPNEVHTLALYYNRAIFAEQSRALGEAGLDANRAPRTWEEVIAYSKALADGKSGNYGLLLDLWGVDPYQRSSIAHMTDLLWQAGASVVEQDANRRWQFVWDRSDGTLDALRFIRELMAPAAAGPIARYRTAGRWNDDQNFGSMSRAPAMVFDFSSSFLAVKVLANPETLGIAPLPAGPVLFTAPSPSMLARVKADEVPHRWPALRRSAIDAGATELVQQMDRVEARYCHPTRAGWLMLPGNREAALSSLVNFGDGWRVQASQIDASMFGITRLTTDPARRDAAWKYLNFLNSREARRIRTELMIEGGMTMFLNPDLLSESGYEDLYESIPLEWRRAYREIRASGRPAPSGANCQYIHQVLARMADSLLVITPQAEQRRLSQDATIRSAWRSVKDSPSTAASTATSIEDDRFLRDAARESRDYAERRLLNRIPPEQQQRTERLGFVLVATLAMAFPLALWSVIRNRPRAEAVELGHSSASRPLMAWSFMAMALGSILLWQYYPLARGAVMAFQDYRVMDSAENATTWVGLRNFAQLFTEPTARVAAFNTLVFVGLSLGIGFFVPIGLAILLDEIPRGTMFFRVLYYLPAAMGGLIVAYLWMWLFSPQPTGWLNQLLHPVVPAVNWIAGVGARYLILVLAATVLVPVCWLVMRKRLNSSAAAGLLLAELALVVALTCILVGPIAWPLRWLSSDPLLAMICVIIPGVWAGLGPGCIIYLAALKAIPDEVYEAADLDGAGIWHKMRHITLPYLKPLIVIQFVGAVISAFRNWEGIFVMTGGGPKDGTLVIGMEVWYNAFAYLRFGYATAMAWVLGACLIGFTVVQLRVLRKARFTTAGRT